MKKLVLFFVISMFVISVSAQEGCAYTLEEAQDMFDAGLIESVPEKLSGCLHRGFTSEEKLQAYKLVILSYLYDDNLEDADRVMLEFLSEYPSYEPVATDPREFIVLMESYDRRPVLMIGGSLGINFTFPLITGRMGTYNYSTNEGNYLPGGAGFHGSFRIDKQLNERFGLSGEISFSHNRFDFYLDNDTEDQAFTGEITDFSNIEYYETQNRLSIPLSVNYNLNNSRLRPTFLLGVAPSILFTATGDGYREYANTDKTRYDPVIVSNVEIMPVRRFINLVAFAGIGLEYKVGPGELFMDARFCVQVLNQVPQGADRFVQKLAFETFYVTDNLLLNHVAISAGYMFPIYHPKKISE